ncbi:PrsW family intramembrane metalloprotease [Patescibacteria group bacterium]|nr:PrsW family intramembrane metalloprotease [Patescibacteria group bacterium]
MEVFSVQTIGYAVLGGIVPPLIWLYFLLRESARCPEPGTLILMAFIAGMFAVPIVIPFESYALAHLANGLPVIVGWAVIEETLKYVFAALLILWRSEVDDPIDLVIYMLTVALGFAALENTLFLITPFTHGDVSSALITGNLRFVGSTLLHVIASSAIGFSLAFSFKAARLVRTAAAALGLILAVTLHTLFNFFIINENGSQTVLAFFVVWTGAVVFFALFEVLKYFRYRNVPANTC